MGKPTNRWVVLGAAGVFNALIGAMYVWSVFNIPLAAEHNWSAPEVAFAYSLYICVESVAGFIAGILQRRMKASTLALIGSACFASGWFAVGFVPNITMLYVCFSIFGGMGSGCLYNISVAVATKWFPDKRGLANGICIGATGLSPLIFAPLANMLVQNMGVNASFNVCGVAFFLVALAAFRLLTTPPENWQPEGWKGEDTEGENALAHANVTTKGMLSTPTFYVLWLLFACAASGGMMAVSNASGIGQQLAGLTAAEATSQVGIFALANFTGRIVFGSLSDKFGRFPMMILAMGITALVMLFGFQHVHEFVLLTALLALVGACFGGIMVVMPALCADLYGNAHFGQNYALLFSGYSCASVIGPMLAANILASTGTYDAAFIGAGALTLAGIALACVAAALAKKEKARRATGQQQN